MKYELLAIALIGAVAAHPAPRTTKREVPQEHAHENILKAVNNILMQDNPDQISDAVFGLLGAAAAANGAGDIADPDCLQQATADQAFTNAKAIGDVDAMTSALIFRALERNTGSVGLASVPCTSIKAVNPEIAALQQHQDPASDGAQALNKEIASELARQIAAIGGDPTLANEASTFAPGEIGDPTGAGNTCDDADDEAGCINTQNLRVDDLTADEIAAAVAGAGAGAGAGQAAANGTANAGADAGANAGNNNAANGCDIVDDSKADDESADAGDAQADAGNANAGAGNANADAGNGQAASGSAQASAGAGAGAADFGGCDPSITFGLPSDGRQEDAFEPSDLTTFNHGSAQKIGIISSFICQQLPNKCDVDAAAVSACDSAATAASSLTGQAAADAFNSALGL